MRRAALLCSWLCAGLGAAACDFTPPSVASGDVFELTPCTGTGPTCRKIADGRARYTILVATSVPGDRKPSIPITLKTSAGTWLIPKDPATPTATVADIGPTGAASAVLVLPVALDPIRVTGEWQGYMQELWVQPAPAEIALVALAATPASIPASRPATISVRADARVEGTGGPSQGTSLAFTIVEVAPPNATAAIGPPVAWVDAMGGATASFVAGSDLVSVKIRVTATRPSLPGDPTPPTPASAELVLSTVK